MTGKRANRFNADPLRGGSGLEAGGFKAIEDRSGCAGWCSGGQAKMAQDFGKDRRLFDGNDDFQFTAAVRTVFDVDDEVAFPR